MNVRPFKTACELQDMIVERARTLRGPWPSGMTMSVFGRCLRMEREIGRPTSDDDNFYRTRALDLITMFKVRHDLDGPRL